MFFLWWVILQVRWQASQERVAELKVIEADLRKQAGERETEKAELQSKITALELENTASNKRLKKTEEDHRLAEERWKTDNDRLQVLRHALFI